MKEHKFILSALISLMLCFSFIMDVYAQKNVNVQTKAQTETKKPIVKNHKYRISGSASRGMSDAEKGRIIQNLVNNMVHVSGGTFTMGATSEQGSDALEDEMPAHRVTLSSFYIGKYEVTQAEWKAVMGSNPSRFNGDDRPVENVSWDDCQAFIAKLNELAGKTFSLPTEAQWEFTARGGNSSNGNKYSGSNNIDDVSWFKNNSGSTTHHVGTKSANELGLYDMSGNVWEWCSNVYEFYSSKSQTNPTGPCSDFDRVFRGGSWFDDTSCSRVSSRLSLAPGYRSSSIGLRLVLCVL